MDNTNKTPNTHTFQNKMKLNEEGKCLALTATTLSKAQNNLRILGVVCLFDNSKAS